MTYLLPFLIGCFTGLRSLTPIAAVCWAARLGMLPLAGTSLGWFGSLPAVISFTLVAVGELIADKLPKTPSRTAAVGLIARATMGALTGAAVALAAGLSIALGGGLGVAGGLTGAFAGYYARTGLVRAFKVPDYAIALLEDLLCIAGSWLIVTHS